MRTVSCLVGCLCLAAGWARAGDVMYARSDGAYMARENPSRYTALNVLDNDKTTAWCSAGTGQNAEIEIVFFEATSIDRVDVATGNQMDANDFAAFGRVREIQLQSGEEVHSLKLSDKTGLQTFRFDPTIHSDRLLLKMKAAYRGKKERHVCLTDVVFYAGKKIVQGKDLGRHIRAHGDALPFLDTWVSGPSDAREKELVFGVRGDFRFIWVPADPDQPSVRLKGAWRLSDNELQVKPDKEKQWLSVKVKRDDAERVERLKIEDSPMAGVYDRRRTTSLDW
ncbi:MAG: discoidin domain-containing protein [Myxococcales bacterium]|nr:discoidin domain-containing protein [Myxococcales bacterium]